MSLFSFVFLKIFLLLFFWERGRRNIDVRVKRRSTAACMLPTRCRAHDLRMWSDQELNRQPFGAQDDSQPPEPHGPGHFSVIFMGRLPLGFKSFCFSSSTYLRDFVYKGITLNFEEWKVTTELRRCPVWYSTPATEWKQEQQTDLWALLNRQYLSEILRGFSPAQWFEQWGHLSLGVSVVRLCREFAFN